MVLFRSVLIQNSILPHAISNLSIYFEVQKGITQRNCASKQFSGRTPKLRYLPLVINKPHQSDTWPDSADSSSVHTVSLKQELQMPSDHLVVARHGMSIKRIALDMLLCYRRWH